MSEYISREAAQKRKEERINYFANILTGRDEVFVRAICTDILSIPAADVAEVRHGRWVETIEPMGWDEVTCAECSVCGEDFVLDDWGMEDMKNLFLYCPNCGAKMDESEDE